MKTWVAVVNRCEARLFEINEKSVNGNGRNHDKLKLVKRMENPRGRLKSQDINADRPGFSKSSFVFSGTRLTKPQDPTDRVADMFAKDVGAELEKGYNEHLFDDLILVVEPHFLGKLRSALSKRTFSTIRSTLHKDLAHVPDHELPSFLWPKNKEAEAPPL